MKRDCTLRRFGDIAFFRRGLTFSKEDVAERTSKQVLRSNNISLENSSLNFDDVACLREDFDIPEDRKLHAGDIFICMSNGSTQHLGKVAYISSSLDMAFGGFMGVIEPNPELVLPRYMFCSCRSRAYRMFLNSIFNGANINNLKWSELSKFEIPVPPKDVQERIVAELDLLTGVIDKQKAQLNELDTLAQSIFYDMFGDPVENPKGWKQQPFGTLADFKNGLNFSPDESGIDYVLVGVSDFQTKAILDCDTSLKTVSLARPLQNDYLLRDGDILFVRSNGNKELIARNVLIRSNGLKVTYSGFCIRARIIQNSVQPFFVNALLKLPSAHKALVSSGRGCNIANLNQGTLNGFDIIMPPLSLQQAFADKIASIEKQKSAINQSIAETQKLLDYTMDKYFG